MTSSIDPKSMGDPSRLRVLKKNAQERGRPDIAFACQLRIAELAGAAFNDPVERDFWSAVSCAEEFKSEENGKKTPLSRTRQKYKRVGVIQCLTDWAIDPKTTDGFKILLRADRPDLTGEAIVLRHRARFSDAAVTAARKKLEEHGIDLTKIEEDK